MCHMTMLLDQTHSFNTTVKSVEFNGECSLRFLVNQSMSHRITKLLNYTGGYS